MEARPFLILLNLVSFVAVFLLFLSGKNPFYFVWYYFLQHIPLFKLLSAPENWISYIDKIFDKAYRIVLVMLSFNFISLMFHDPTKTFTGQHVPIKAKLDVSRQFVDRVPIRAPIAVSLNGNSAISDQVSSSAELIRIHEQVIALDDGFSDLHFKGKMERASKLPLVLPQTRPYCAGVTILPGKENIKEHIARFPFSKPRLLPFASQFDITDEFYATALIKMKQVTHSHTN